MLATHQTTLPLCSPPAPSEGASSHLPFNPYSPICPSPLPHCCFLHCPATPATGSICPHLAGTRSPAPPLSSTTRAQHSSRLATPCPPPSLMNLSVGHMRALLAATPRRQHAPGASHPALPQYATKQKCSAVGLENVKTGKNATKQETVQQLTRYCRGKPRAWLR